ncbi:hypothetical protein [Streptomyces sp. WM6378]|uniref:hypothetical protein n=1 Tax=Streptomyces sp. WM6378 TaxID=1415557 RepID=UPI000B108459|nr:hypothetical protein [Streptomyces sp. WM6378]
MAGCDVCLGEMADGEGVLEVDTAKADRALHPRRRWSSGILPRMPRELNGGSVGDT